MTSLLLQHIAFSAISSAFARNENLYKGAQVWRTDLQGSKDILVIKKLMDNQDISIWNLSPVQADYLVRPVKKVKVDRLLKNSHLEHNVLMLDVQRRVDAALPMQGLWNEHSLRSGHRLNWKSYPTLSIIDEYYKFLAESYPSLCKLQNIGRTSENRNIQILNVSNGNPDNEVVLVTAGAHAREWVSIMAALYIANDIITNFDHQPDYIKNKNWLIVPVLNPDGFEFSQTTDRLWRKNRRAFSDCVGVDLNRNFETDWSIAGITETNQCAESYSGPFPFSEAESTAMRNLIKGIKKTPSALIDLHSYGNLILYPWSGKYQATQHSLMHKTTAWGMSQAIFNLTKQNYMYGPTYHMIYPATGALIDWAYDSGVHRSFAIETSDKGNHGFLIPPQYIEDTGKEMLEAVRQLVNELEIEYRLKDVMLWFK